MPQFVVPQFIDVEDKIFGPITTRQFLILLIGGGIIYLAYELADFILFVIILSVVGALSLVIAFVKINGQTFHYFLLNFFQTIKKPSLRIWKKEYSKEELNYLRKQGSEMEEEFKQEKKIVRAGHIRDLSLLVNTGGYYKPDTKDF
ncbi:MAG: PrgI family protein [Candidatus Magasanikbacteria bacterium]|jgi:5-bromo-4-chloroindolyl phosphate hydrolysis protein|nr:PrgI family protein [Candidatus Magasanikbacteria bacterium]